MFHKAHFLSTMNVRNIWIALGILLALLASCKPFEISAVVEPNNVTSASGRSFEVAVNIEPEVAAVLESSLAEERIKTAGTTVNAATTGPTPTTAAASAEPVLTTANDDKATAATPTYPAIVPLVALNVRSGPGTDYAKVGGLAEGAIAHIVGKNSAGGWWQIVYPAVDGERAWVSAGPSYSQVYHVENVPVVATPSLPQSQPRLVINTDRYGANSLMIMNLDGSGRKWVHYGYGTDNVYAAVSPNGAKVAFVSDRDGNQEIYLVNIDGTDLTRLTYTPEADKWPAWSPDSQRIVFDSERDGNREIYTMNADGSGVFRVTTHWAEDGAPAWSPDGTRLVFHSDREGNHEIYTMRADGSNVRRLTYHPGNEWTPAWSPNGTQIAFMGYHDSQSAEIYVMDANGGNLRNLTNHPSEDAVPVWSPDGRQIAFESRRDGNLETYVMDATGGNLKRVTFTDSNDGRPAWVAP